MLSFRKRWLLLLAHFAALTPLAVLIWDGLHDQLTFNPIQEVTHRTGKTALIMLLLSLSATPLNTVFGWKRILPLRRTFGLYAFFYASLHLLIFAVVDYGLNWALIQQEIGEKRYVLVGFTAFLLLIPLAVTSTRGWQRRLGQRWKPLHRLVYVAAPLVIFHYLWLVKADYRKPALYGLVLTLMLSLRLPIIRRTLRKLRAPRVRLERGNEAAVNSRVPATD
jgi:sulfoxide reductase heme-binding subunit YedZ